MEVFSYGCPACNQFNAVAKKIKSSLPAECAVGVPAGIVHSYRSLADVPARVLRGAGAWASRTRRTIHVRSVWRGGELAISDPTTRRLKSPLPSIEDAGKFYARVAGVKLRISLQRRSPSAWK